MITTEQVRLTILRAGVKDLRSFGYPHVTMDNIITDAVYSMAFRRSLANTKLEFQENPKVKHLVPEIQKVMDEIDKAHPKQGKK